MGNVMSKAGCDGHTRCSNAHMAHLERNEDDDSSWRAGLRMEKRPRKVGFGNRDQL